MARATLVIVPDEGAAEMVRAALVEAGIQPEFARHRPEHPYLPTVFAEPWKILVPAERLQDARNALARLEHDIAGEADAQARAWQGREDDREDDREGAGADAGANGPAPPLEPSGLARAQEPLFPDARRKPRLLTALALGFVLPFPAVCFYARARRLGALLLGIFVASIALALCEGIWSVGLDGLVLLDGEQAAEETRPRETSESPVAAARLEAVEPPDPNEHEPRAGFGALALVEWISLLGLLTKVTDLGAGMGLILLARAHAPRTARAT